MTARVGKPGQLSRSAVRRRFDRAALKFDDADFVHRQAADGLLERMLPMRLEVKRVLDAGAACGDASRVLRRRFRGSHIISLDLSLAMLQAARRARSRFSRISELQADAMALPIRSDSIDLVFANLLLPWIDDLGSFLAGVARVLRKDGLFVFSTLGPDSLAELRDAWRAIDDAEHVNPFMDMHNVGDALVQAGLREPVVDVEHLTVTYGSVQSLFSDLTDAGARNCLQGRARGLTGRGRSRPCAGRWKRASTMPGLPSRWNWCSGMPGAAGQADRQANSGLRRRALAGDRVRLILRRLTPRLSYCNKRGLQYEIVANCLHA
jgi:malonyl-CoA O-methyltransferase